MVKSQRFAGFLPLGVFFFFGATMASFAAISLTYPGSFLDRAWTLNPTAHVQLASMGRTVAVPFVVLSVALLLAGIGWFRGRYWGWLLGTAIIGINLVADLIHFAMGDYIKSAVGVVVAGALLFYMTRMKVRDYFRGEDR